MSTLLLIGLGNPGAKYQQTPHNVGFSVLQSWVTAALDHDTYKVTQDWRDSIDLNAQEAHVEASLINGTMRQIICLLPLTYMNKSGMVALAALQKYQLPLTQTLIIHDDIELLLGEIKLVRSGGAAGHNGIRSIHAALQTTDVPRLRLGVGRPPQDMPVKDFVLTPFTEQQKQSVDTMINHALKLLFRISQEGLETLLPNP